MNLKLLKWSIWAVLAWGMASCASSRPVVPAVDEDVLAAEYEVDSAEAFILEELQQQLLATMPPPGSAIRMILEEAYSWQGTPYKYGGLKKGKGTDCSGFIMEAYRNALGVKLPRTAALQAEYCKNIRKKNLEPGDLVFFKPKGGKKVSHVGLYVGNDLMLHASASHGVMLSRLTEDYWQRAFHSAGRLPEMDR